MSTPPIQIPISAIDQTSPAFATVTARIKAFDSASSASFGNAKGAARLLNSELDTGLNRTLVSLLASSNMLGNALAVAFPIAAAVGFAEVAWTVGQRLADIVNRSDEARAGFDRISKLSAEAFRLSEQAFKLNEETGLIGASAAQKYRAELEKVNRELSQQEGHERSILQTINGVQLVGGGFPSSVAGGNGPEDLPQLRANLQKVQEEMALSKARQLNLEAKLKLAQHESAEQFAKDWDANVKRIDAAYLKWAQMVHKARVDSKMYTADTGAKPPDNPLISSQLETFGSSIYAAGFHENLAQFEPSPVVVDRIRERLNALNGELRFTKDAWHSFGFEIGDSMKQGILFGQSWSNVLKTIAVDLIQLILKLTVLKDLQKTSGGGGFWGAIIGGLAGMRAGGGPVVGGMSYLVGENGPELFTPGRSGLISPSGSFGGGQIIQHFDMRGSIVTDDVVRRAEIAGIQRGAVHQSLMAQKEINLRR